MPEPIGHRGVEWYAQLSERAAERAVDIMRSGCQDDGPDAALSVAVIAWDVASGFATDEQRSDMNEYVLTDDGGYEIDMSDECICPPELLARDGFKGGCPVHA
jgi:hypothetical protein